MFYNRFSLLRESLENHFVNEVFGFKVMLVIGLTFDFSGILVLISGTGNYYCINLLLEFQH